jgi:hypothetical protein
MLRLREPPVHRNGIAAQHRDWSAVPRTGSSSCSIRNNGLAIVTTSNTSDFEVTTSNLQLPPPSESGDLIDSLDGQLSAAESDSMKSILLASWVLGSDGSDGNGGWKDPMPHVQLPVPQS